MRLALEKVTEVEAENSKDNPPLEEAMDTSIPVLLLLLGLTTLGR